MTSPRTGRSIRASPRRTTPKDDVASDLDVPVYSGGGFDGLKGKRASADRAVRRFRDLGQRTVVLQVSDLDSHGLSMVRARVEDIEAWTADALPFPAPSGSVVWRVSDVLRFERIAVTEAQAIEHDLLDDEGNAEADGLPVPVMDALLTDAIRAAWGPVPARREERQQVERDRLADTIRAALNGDADEET